MADAAPAQPLAEPRRKLTPIWTLKASQMLGAAAFACLGKYLPVYYADIGLERSLIGTLGFVGMGATFFGQLFWSAVIDYLGEYKSVLVFTQFLGTATLFLYCLPVVKGSVVLVFIVALINTFLMSTGGSIIDALCMRVLADYKMALKPDSTPRTVSGAQQSYGDTRLFSAVGWGGMSLVMGQIIDTLGINFMFVGFAAIQAVNVGIVVWFMPSPSKEQVAQDAAKAAAEEASELAAEGGSSGGRKLCNLNVAWFFANLLMYGVSMCLIENFLFIFLVEDFENTPNLLLGASTAVMCFFEIPVFKYMGPYLEKQPIGNERAITIVLFGCQVITALRCWMYTVVPKDMVWLSILVSPFHGVCFAAMWGASMEYAKRLSGKRNLAKMTSLVNGVYYNVSMGIGSVAWGALVEPPPKGLGFIRSFQVDIYFILAWSVIWQIGLFLLSRRSVRAPEMQEGLASSA
jgi:MFS family permease